MMFREAKLENALRERILRKCSGGEKLRLMFVISKLQLPSSKDDVMDNEEELDDADCVTLPMVPPNSWGQWPSQKADPNSSSPARLALASRNVQATGLLQLPSIFQKKWEEIMTQKSSQFQSQ